MKKKLLRMYLTYISFYLLLKAEGKNTQDHPVIFKIAHTRQLLEKIEPLDEKVKKSLSKVIKK